MERIKEFFLLIWNLLVVYFEIIRSWFESENEPRDFYGKVIVLTGSAQGLGKEMALRLNRLGGVRLALIDIDRNRNDELIERLKTESPNADIIGYECDLSDSSDIDFCCGQILKHFGRVDILINNAGIVQCKSFLELEAKDIRRTFDVNVFAHFWLIKQFLPGMIDRGTGHIVAIASACGLSGKANLVDYCAAKHAVVGMMTAFDCELRQLNLDEQIRLTTVCPITIATGMFRYPTTRFSSLLPILSPDKVAKTIIDTIRKSDPSSTFLITIPSYTYWLILIEKMIPRKAFAFIDQYLSYQVGKH